MYRVEFEKTEKGMELMAAFLVNLRYHGTHFRATIEDDKYIIDLV